MSTMEPQPLEPQPLEPQSLEPQSLEPQSLEPQSLEPQPEESNSCLEGENNAEEDNATISLNFEEVSQPVNGKDVELNLMLHSEDTEPRTLSININVVAKSVNGTACYEILSDKKEQTLNPGKDLCVPVVVPFDQYWPKMLDNDVMNVTASVFYSSYTKEKSLEYDVVLEDPPFNIDVLGEAFVKQPVFLEMSLVNPASETLKSCTITVSGSGLLTEDKEISLPDVGPEKKIRVKVSFVPYRSGEKTLTAAFNCSVFRDIKKSVPITVKEQD